MRLRWRVDVPVGSGTVGLIPDNIVLTADMDRVPYLTCEVSAPGALGGEVWTALDPRDRSVPDPSLFVWGEDASGIVLDYFGRRASDVDGPLQNPFTMTRRAITRDRVDLSTSLRLASRESLLDDRIRNAVDARDTGATTVGALVRWAVQDTLGAGTAVDTGPSAATAIPAGERRLMQPGVNFNDVYESEAQAIGYRLFDHFGRALSFVDRTAPPNPAGYNTLVQLSTYRGIDLPAAALPIVRSLKETVSRDGDFADGALVSWDMQKFGGGIARERSGNGSNTKGRSITYTQPSPGTGAANQIAGRAALRGYDFTVVADFRFDVLPGFYCTVYTRDGGLVAGIIRSITWDCAAKEMALTVQSGQPV